MDDEERMMREITTDLALVANVAQVLAWDDVAAAFNRIAPTAQASDAGPQAAYQALGHALEQLRTDNHLKHPDRPQTGVAEIDWIEVQANLPASFDALAVRAPVPLARWLGRRNALHAAYVDLHLQAMYEGSRTQWPQRTRQTITTARQDAQRRLRARIAQLCRWPFTASLHALELPNETWLTPVPECSTGVAGRAWRPVLPAYVPTEAPA